MSIIDKQRISAVRRVEAMGLFAAIVFFASIGFASAGDGYGPQPRPFSWTGMYIGANAGYSWGRAQTDLTESQSVRVRRFFRAGPFGSVFLANDTTTTAAFSSAGTAHVDGALGGGHVGFRWQSGLWVFGLEADI